MTYEDLRPMEKEIIEALWDAKKNDPPSYIAMLGLMASKNNTDFIKKKDGTSVLFQRSDEEGN